MFSTLLSMTKPEGSQLGRAIGVMAEIVPGEALPRVRAWSAGSGEGTPLMSFRDGDLSWIYFSAEDPRTLAPQVLNRLWVERLFAEPQLGTALAGVFALIAIDARRNQLIALCDRLGIQSLFYASDASQVLRISTHQSWLLLANQHDGSVDPDAFCSHLGFGYPVEPYRDVYQGVSKLPASGYVRVADGKLTRGTYWTPPASGSAEAPPISELAESLRTALTSVITADGVCLGVTAGKDSLCLASVVTTAPLAGTFGLAESADQRQAELLTTELGWPRVVGTVCSPDEIGRWARHVAIHSAGLATASYVDMAAFVATQIPPGYLFAMGEGGECVRDFFSPGGRPPLATIEQDYMTPADVLHRTLVPALRVKLDGYPTSLLARVRAASEHADDVLFATQFYRFQRMSGNFSLRHGVLAALRGKISPFLAADFIDRTYGLDPSWYVDSRLHRAVIAHARPELLRYFDQPVASTTSVQDWSGRFAGGVGLVVHELLESTLHLCEDVFQPSAVLALCRDAIDVPSRAIYYLFRVLSFSLGRAILRVEATERMSGITDLALA